MAPEKVPVIQKHIIRRSADWRKPVITATQMLESMIENPRPTRAEASDVANAIFDGTDAVMLSAETASGSYPCQAVAMMAKIVVEAESNLAEFTTPKRRTHRGLSIAETICESIAHAAEDLQMGAIAVFTDTGTTARLISKYRPNPAIHAFSHVPAVCNRMNLLWGVHPILHEHTLTVEGMVNASEKQLLRQGSVRVADVLGVVGGTRMSTGSTNFMRLHVVTSAEKRAAASAKKSRSPAERKP
jgi:pyruvate kinase